VVAQRGALDSAEALHRRAVAIRAASVGPEHPLTALSVVPLATVLTQQRRFTEADSLYRWALGLLRHQTIDTHLDIRRTYAGLAMLYEAWGKRDSAAIYRQRAGSSDLRLR
jgi:serine/threonine-protein kinase